MTQIVLMNGIISGGEQSPFVAGSKRVVPLLTLGFQHGGLLGLTHFVQLQPQLAISQTAFISQHWRQLCGNLYGNRVFSLVCFIS